MSEERLENEVLHRVKNKLGLAIGFGNLLLDDMPADDPRRADLLTIHTAVRDALSMLPELARQLK
jgi:hypothetical protein